MKEKLLAPHCIYVHLYKNNLLTRLIKSCLVFLFLFHFLFSWTSVITFVQFVFHDDVSYDRRLLLKCIDRR
jgi:hypothetical protein